MNRRDDRLVSPGSGEHSAQYISLLVGERKANSLPMDFEVETGDDEVADWTCAYSTPADEDAEEETSAPDSMADALHHAVYGSGGGQTIDGSNRRPRVSASRGGGPSFSVDTSSDSTLFNIDKETFRVRLRKIIGEMDDEKKFNIRAARSQADKYGWPVGKINVCPRCGRTVIISMDTDVTCTCEHETPAMIRLPDADSAFWEEFDG